MEVIDLDLQGNFGHFDSEFKEFRLVHVDLSENHQICTKYASWDSHCWYWKWEALTLTFKVIWPFRLKKRHSTSLFYTDLGWARGATRPKRALAYIYECLFPFILLSTWWRHQMKTLSVLLTLCEWNPPASDAELWCFLWFAPEQTVEETIETPVIWDAIVLIMTSL